MPTIVIEHVPITELPAHWQSKLNGRANSRVTVRIEEETTAPGTAAGVELTANPMFGMWADREEIADVAAYLRTLRAPRYQFDGSRSEE